MTHAERCPICWGKGVVKSINDGSGTAVPQSQPCYACDGRGWIEVSDGLQPVYGPVYDTDTVRQLDVGKVK